MHRLLRLKAKSPTEVDLRGFCTLERRIDYALEL
jgi:hypothetical protein